MNMASVTISKHTLASANGGQMSHCFREHARYSNEDIDTSLSSRNIVLGCRNASEARSRLRNRIEEVDKVLPPKRVRKDRVVAIEYCVPAPREDMELEDQVYFLRTAYNKLKDEFGCKNIICGTIHVDERHEYKDVDGKHTSRAHLHVIGVPFVPDKGINGKNFLQKDTYGRVNEAMDDICKDLYGFKFQDGSKQRSRGSVEQLKHAQKQVAAYEHTKTQEVNERLLIYGETRKNAIDTALGDYKKKEARKAVEAVQEHRDKLNEDIANLERRSMDLQTANKCLERNMRDRSKRAEDITKAAEQLLVRVNELRSNQLLCNAMERTRRDIKDSRRKLIELFGEYEKAPYEAREEVEKLENIVEAWDDLER